MNKKDMGLKLINLHKNAEPYSFRKWSEMWSTQGIICDVENLTEINESEMIFTTCVRIDITKKKGRDIIRKMLKNQSSPVKIVLQEKEAQARADVRENKGVEWYTVPKEIEELLEKDKK